MANGVPKPTNAFEGATSVMESGLLRVLTKKSSTERDTGGWSAVGDEPETEVIVEQPHPTMPESEVPTASVVAPPMRRSRVIVVSAIVAAVVLAADVSMFVALRRRPRAQPAPPPLPTYMVVPPAAALPAPPVRQALPDAPPVTLVPAEQPKPRAHAHHKRSRSSR